MVKHNKYLHNSEDVFWYAVLQIALAHNGVHSLSKASEISRISLKQCLDLESKISRISG